MSDQTCETCTHKDLESDTEPCRSCAHSYVSAWQSLHEQPKAGGVTVEALDAPLRRVDATMLHALLPLVKFAARAGGEGELEKLVEVEECKRRVHELGFEWRECRSPGGVGAISLCEHVPAETPWGGWQPIAETWPEAAEWAEAQAPKRAEEQVCIAKLVTLGWLPHDNYSSPPVKFTRGRETVPMPQGGVTWPQALALVEHYEAQAPKAHPLRLHENCRWASAPCDDEHIHGGAENCKYWEPEVPPCA